jgi:hypothetical protein
MLMPPIALERKKIVSNSTPLVFITCIFNTHIIAYCYCVIPCQCTNLGMFEDLGLTTIKMIFILFLKFLIKVSLIF